ncbi:MAG: aldehyde dehydrogenase family protein [Planctomycetota bacterium]
MGHPDAPHPDTSYLSRAEPWWRDHSDRAAWLRGFRSRIARDTHRLAHLIHEEVGKPLDEAIAADVMALLASVKWHEKRGAGVLRERRQRGKPAWILGVSSRVQREPIGRVGIIATWNYPVQLLGIQIVQALFAGNSVVVKPSEHAPRTQRALLELAAEGLPGGTLTWTDATREAGRDLLKEHRLDHVVFTGSTSVGRMIASTLAEPLVPSTLELSGKDSAFVLDDADPMLAARTIWQYVTVNSGQTCMAPRRALVHTDVYAEFVRQLGLLAAGESPRTLITRDAALEAHRAAVEGVEAGGRPISGVLEEPGGPDGRTMRPVAIADCPEDAPTVRGDHFGPVIALVPVRDTEHALRVHHACGQHLATSVFTKSKHRVRDLAHRLGSSVVTHNDVIMPTAHPATFLGGRGPSGWGVSRGAEGLLAMTRPVHVASTGRLRLPTGPTPPDQAKRLTKLVSALYGTVDAHEPTTDDHAPHTTHDPSTDHQEAIKP